MAKKVRLRAKGNSRTLNLCHHCVRRCNYEACGKYGPFTTGTACLREMFTCLPFFSFLHNL